jgi:uncharacterized protein
LTDPGPSEWQALWEATLPGARWVYPRKPEHPDRDAWVARVDAAVAACAEPPLIVAHSSGALVVAHWAAHAERSAKALVLVAPPDVERRDCPEEIMELAPMPRAPLPCPSVVLAFSDDPHVRLERARWFAETWGSRFVNAGPIPRSSAALGHKLWPAGGELLAQVQAERGPSPAMH